LSQKDFVAQVLKIFWIME